MANHKKATHHHGKAGDALAKGDLKMAAHHMGHALAALRSSVGAANGLTQPDDDPSDLDDAAPDGAEERASSSASLRSRLGKFGKKA